MRLALVAVLVIPTAYAADTATRVTHVGPVAPDTLAITIDTGQVELGDQVPYEAQAGDAGGEFSELTGWSWTLRDGRAIGARVGRDGRLLQLFDRVVSPPLDGAALDRPGYRVSSGDAPAYADGQAPRAVHRKSKPTDMVRTDVWTFGFTVRHVVYLLLPAPLQVGKRYTVAFPDDLLSPVEYTHEPRRVRSEAVHVTQIGFRPDDLLKQGFVSCWMGTGGGVQYAAGAPFLVLDDRTGEEVFRGELALSKAGADESEDVYKRNYNLVDVYRADFSELRTAGTFRLCLPEVGCSYPFAITDTVWRDAFLVSAKSFYTQRSGIEIGPPYSPYRRPRCFHPDDGVKVYASTCSLMDSGNGLNARGTDKDNFGNLVAGRTNEVVDNAWGGYFDAGDWDRRIQHLEATRLQLELADMFPQFVAAADLNIPESGDDLPDLVNEALWNLDCYRRMQLPEGGIRGGIESAEHPRFGEGSWQESLLLLAYAPDPWSSYIYAGVAARAATWLRERKPELSAVYGESALRAMAWAEAELPRLTGYEKLPHAVADARNLAAVELYRLTGDSKWHDLFLATTALKEPGVDLFVYEHHDQPDAPFVYVRLPGNMTRPDVRANCLAALRREADTVLATGTATAFGWMKRNSWVPVGWGCLTVPQAVALVRMHFLTSEERYLRGILQACQFGAGANPANLCSTTGLGQESPQHPLCVDARISHQAPPAGITVFGPRDVQRPGVEWVNDLIRPVCMPEPTAWPTTEAYYDIFLHPEVCEFTVMSNLGPNSYVWGYLAAREGS